MKRFDSLLNRLQSLEPKPIALGPWPPREGSLSRIFYDEIGRPAKRMSIVEMCKTLAKQVWEPDDEAA